MPRACVLVIWLEADHLGHDSWPTYLGVGNKTNPISKNSKKPRDKLAIYFQNPLDG
eukprot:CAMPEP_0203788426 /NCGR_PEP_ID=MMETSP0100_2-20121128/2843_1 /ASSEMBLY_ACC=CAM_ASM_000210 /TAXON_ID=96639 /ORGANISM=" , Strain NY0313808BC1" /LENGTH=55 /DNA_ID=CAMNT_0050691173 /DNA_START=901 /DNA_END=1064 /DNA_ORIENTATION=-